MHARSACLPATVMLVMANLIWAGQGVAVKLLNGSLGPLAVALLPFYAATAIGFCTLSPRPGFRERLAVAWACRWEFLMIGIGGQFLAQVGMTLGVTWSYAAAGAILSLLIPMLSALIAIWLVKERLTVVRLVCLLLGVGGVMLLSPVGAQVTRHVAVRPLAGNLMISAGCLGSAFYNVYSKRLLSRFSDHEILFFSYLATTFFSLPLLAYSEPGCLIRLAHFDPIRWFALAILRSSFTASRWCCFSVHCTRSTSSSLRLRCTLFRCSASCSRSSFWVSVSKPGR
jgi:drug/metabolite transporter (DMT)-like permease